MSESVQQKQRTTGFRCEEKSVSYELAGAARYYYNDSDVRIVNKSFFWIGSLEWSVWTVRSKIELNQSERFSSPRHIDPHWIRDSEWTEIWWNSIVCEPNEPMTLMVILQIQL